MPTNGQASGPTDSGQATYLEAVGLALLFQAEHDGPHERAAEDAVDDEIAHDVLLLSQITARRIPRRV